MDMSITPVCIYPPAAAKMLVLALLLYTLIIVFVPLRRAIVPAALIAIALGTAVGWILVGSFEDTRTMVPVGRAIRSAAAAESLAAATGGFVIAVVICAIAHLRGRRDVASAQVPAAGLVPTALVALTAVALFADARAVAESLPSLPRSACLAFAVLAVAAAISCAAWLVLSVSRPHLRFGSSRAVAVLIAVALLVTLYGWHFVGAYRQAASLG